MTTTNKYITTELTTNSLSMPISYKAAQMAFFFASISLLLIVVLHFVKSELTPAGHMLSEYAIGQSGWVMKLSFFAWAFSCFATVYGIHSQITNTAGRIGQIFLFIAGIALIMGGVFVIDSPYAEKIEPTTHGNLHGLSAMIGLPGQAIASLLISYSLKRNPNWHQGIKSVTWFAHFTWISLILMIASTIVMFGLSQGKFSPVSAIGWFNRLLVVVYCCWLMIIAIRTMQIGKKHIKQNYKH